MMSNSNDEERPEGAVQYRERKATWKDRLGSTPDKNGYVWEPANDTASAAALRRRQGEYVVP